MSEPWFRRNERGIGPGMPIHRNGWILLCAYVVFLIVFPSVLEAYLGYPAETPLRFVTILVVTIPVWLLAWRKTAPEERHLSEE